VKYDEEVLRTAFEQAAAGIAIIAPDGRLVEVNRRMCDLLGYTHDEFNRLTAFDFTHPDDLSLARADVQRLLAGEIASYSRERRYIRKDGMQIWLQTSVTLLRDAAGVPRRFVSVVEDMTQRKALLERERAARAEAERLSELKDQFLATLSHELRTPLSAILGWSQILQRRDFGRDELRAAVQTIERNARIQVQLIEDLLDMSRIAAGTLRLDRQPIEPAPLLEATVHTVRPAADAKGITLDAEIDAFTGQVSADPERLQQVVLNLLSNAIKFSARGGRVHVSLQRVGSQIEIVVADNGAGIAPEFLDHVFERFRQADASTTRRFSGLGLGLSIVRQLVEAHGGAVHAYSAGEGQGATFTVRLPLAGLPAGQVTPPAAMAAGPVDHRAVADLSGLRILVVDDEADARTLVGEFLQECGARVLTAAGVDEAVAVICREPVDLLVSDIAMPGADGYELLARLRELDDPALASLPAVALTAFARSEDRTRALRSGFLLHLSKPVEPAELVATVASAVNRAPSSPRGR
jgi:PAS domain S-box-containing protein